MQNMVMVTPIINTPLGVLVVNSEQGYLLPTRQVEAPNLPLMVGIKVFDELFPGKAGDFAWWQNRLEDSRLYVEGYGDNRVWTHVPCFNLTLEDLHLADRTLLSGNTFIDMSMKTALKDWAMSSQRECVEDVFDTMLPDVAHV